MKRWIMFVITAGAVIAAGIFGFTKRQTYSDTTAEENYMDTLQVALFPDLMIENSCKMIEEGVPDAPIILKGKPIGEMEHLYATGQQKIEITQVYKGDGLQNGDEIYVCSDHWRVILRKDEPRTVERRFVNVMKEDKEYLIFLNGEAAAQCADVPVYKFFEEEFMIVPMFCYENLEENIPEVDEEWTYVPYKEVKNNEFFGMTEYSYEVWNQLKERLFAEYN